MEKKVIILEHNGGRLANQLWNFISVYAYCLERGYECRNYCFYDYAQFFNIPVGNTIIERLFFKPIIAGKNFLRRFYQWYVVWTKKNKTVLFSQSKFNTNAAPHFLPPSAQPDEVLSIWEGGTSDALYLSGWLFRNPVGLKKFYKQIAAYFKPKAEVVNDAHKLVNLMRTRFTQVVGVHIRQGDYKLFENGKYYVSVPAVVSILKEYLKKNNRSASDTGFIICSDEPVNALDFEDLQVAVSTANAATDLFALSLTDVIIGSNSTFGPLAAYLGNKPFIVFQDAMDWNYYTDKKEYFENKYCSFVHY